MLWNPEKNEVVIEWKEEKGKNSSPVFHSFNKTPVKLQLHPRTGDIIRAHFLGGRPHWIARYTISKGYRSTELVGDDGPGWWIANWNKHTDRPLSSPSVKGMLTEWLDKVSDVFDTEKKQLLDAFETVEKNLLFHFKEYEQYGLFFRPESIKRDGGSMCLLDSAVPIDAEGEKAERSKHGNFLDLMEALLEQNEIPEVEELLLEVEDVEEPSFTLDLQEEELLVEEEILFEDDPERFFMMEEAARDEEGFGLVQLEEEFLIEEESEASEGLAEEEAEEAASLEPEIVISEQETEQVETVEPAAAISEVEDAEVPEKAVLPEPVKPIVAEKINRRENIVVGQTLLF